MTADTPERKLKPVCNRAYPINTPEAGEAPCPECGRPICEHRIQAPAVTYCECGKCESYQRGKRV